MTYSAIANIFGNILFSIIGFYAVRYGKKNTDFKAVGIGILLMIFPYLTPNPIIMFAVGIALTAALFF